MKSNRTNRFLGLLRRFFSASAIVMSFLGAAQGASNKFFNSASSGTVWNNATANWGTVSGGPYTSAWATYDFAIFEGTGDTITLTTPTCDRLTFNTNGYTLTGSTLSFGNPGGTSVTVAAGITATISSTINHGYATGIRLAGTGTLVLNGVGNTTNTNPFIADNGTINITGGTTTAGSVWTADTASNTGKLNVSAGTLTVTGASDSLTMATRGVGSMTISGAAPAAVVKSGTGTLTLSANNSYTGTVTVNGGVLVKQAVSGTYTYSGGDLFINNGSTLLFTYRRTDRSVAAGVTADCETDTDLVPAWTAATGAPGVVIQVDDDFAWTNPVPGAATDRVRVYVPQAANTQLFGRLGVTP